MGHGIILKYGGEENRNGGDKVMEYFVTTVSRS